MPEPRVVMNHLIGRPRARQVHGPRHVPPQMPMWPQPEPVGAPPRPDDVGCGSVDVSASGAGIVSTITTGYSVLNPEFAGIVLATPGEDGSQPEEPPC